MKTILFLLALFLLLVTSNTSAQEVSANATRPSATDNAFLTTYRFAEIEFGIASDNKFLTSPLLLKFSFAKKMEVGFLMNGVFNTQLDGGKSITQVGDPGLQLKYQFLNSSDVVIAGVVKGALNKSNQMPWTVYITPSILMNIGQMDGTFGFTNLEGSNTIHYAAAFSPKTTLPIGIYVEFFGDKTQDFNYNYFDFGISYSPKSDLVFDAAVVFGLGKNTQSWLAQLGFTKTLGKVF